MFSPTPILHRLGIAAAALLFAGCGGSSPDKDKKSKTPADLPPAEKQANRLALAKSPFLKRHQSDPVDWYEWGPEAFKQAQEAKMPIMLVIGYSSCPWTLKMQKESYTDKEVAGFLNSHFVNVLVDREDQPDINNIFLRFTFYSIRRSGWPLHIFLTPEGLPVHTSVYLPKAVTPSLPTFLATIQHVSRTWRSDPEYIKTQANLKSSQYQEMMVQFAKGDGVSKLDRPVIDLAYDKLATAYDPVNGGFIAAPNPKFHQATSLDFLMDYASLKKKETFGRRERALGMVTTSLERIAQGALHDHLAGGFHRYCLDQLWAVPQFEKMLYDQGFLASAYLRAYQITGNPRFAEVARKTFDYIASELTHPAGGFYCAENSFSQEASAAGKSGSGAAEGELVEGAYYLWKQTDFLDAAGKDGPPVAEKVFGIGEKGNLPIENLAIQEGRYRGQNILREVTPLDKVAAELKIPLEQAVAAFKQQTKRLLDARRLRPRPPLDDKVLPCWNGVVISALTLGSAVLDDPALLQRAEKAADFTLAAFLDANYPRKRYAEDYACLIAALLDLYEATGGVGRLKAALDLQRRMDSELWDQKDGGYWDGPEDAQLFSRTKSADEATEFSPNAVAALNLVRFGGILGDSTHIQRCVSLMGQFAGQVAATPQGAVTPGGPAIHVRLLKAYDRLSRPGWQFLVTGDAAAPEWKQFQDILRRADRPNSHVVYLDGKEGQQMVAQYIKDVTFAFASEAKPVVHCAHMFRLEKTLRTPQELSDFIKAEF